MELRNFSAFNLGNFTITSALFEPQDVEDGIPDFFINSKVTKISVPEPSLAIGLLVFGIFGKLFGYRQKL